MINPLVDLCNTLSIAWAMPVAGGRPIGLDAAEDKNRNVIERRFCDMKQWPGLATRDDKHAIVYRAAVLIQVAITWTRQLSDTP